MKKQKLTWRKLVVELLKNVPAEIEEFSKEMIDESDRGLALICAEDLSLKFEGLFRAQFSKNVGSQMKKVVAPLFKVGGPLSSFAYRISVAYSAGYISETLFKELERIRSIRNKFAHSTQTLRFSSPPISSIVQQLQSGKEIQDLFMEVESLPENLASKPMSPERCRFIGAYFYAEFGLRELSGTAPKPEELNTELERIGKQYGFGQIQND